MLDININDSAIIGWNGWWTTWDALRKSGWEITVKPRYDNWRRPTDSRKSREKIYIRHAATGMVGRITKENETLNWGGDDFTLDFLCQEHNHRTTAPKIFEERDLNEDDIPHLMELIIKLQGSRKKSANKSRPQAEVLRLRA